MQSGHSCTAPVDQMAVTGPCHTQKGISLTIDYQAALDPLKSSGRIFLVLAPVKAAQTCIFSVLDEVSCSTAEAACQTVKSGCVLVKWVQATS